MNYLPTGAAPAADPLPMVDAYLPMMKSAALAAAGQLGLFEALSAGPLDCAALAQRLQCSEQGTRKLAHFLVTLGYLVRVDAAYRNSDHAQRWFTSAGTIDYSPGLRWNQLIWDLMGNLGDAVRQGGPDRILWERMTAAPELGVAFSSYMRAFAQDLGPDLLRHVPVTAQHRQMLDLGGSHGLHAMRFCQRYDWLQATIVDFPSALHDTSDAIAQAQLGDRISLLPGNLLEQPWGAGQDLVFYLSVAHNQSALQNQEVFSAIRRTLNPGGMLVLHEYLDDESPNPYFAAFRLTLLLETGTRTHGHAEYCDWLGAAGFSDVQRIDLDPPEKGSLLIAR